MLKLKKLLAAFVMLCLLFTTTACTEFIDAVENTSNEPEYSDEDIYNAFLEAYDFYISWIYGQYYIDWFSTVEQDGQCLYEVTHEEIKTADQLIEKIYSYFPQNKAHEYVLFLQPHDINGKLYIYSGGGVGDNGIIFDTYTVEKTDDTSYILTIFLGENFFTGEKGISKVMCVAEDDKLLFDDYTDSSSGSDLVTLFQN